MATVSLHAIASCGKGAHTAHATVAGPQVFSITFLYFLIKAVHLKELTKIVFFHIFPIDCSVIVPDLGYYKVFLKMKRIQRKSLTEIFAPNCVLDVRGLRHGRSLIYICNSPKPVQYFSFFFLFFVKAKMKDVRVGPAFISGAFLPCHCFYCPVPPQMCACCCCCYSRTFCPFPSGPR